MVGVGGAFGAARGRAARGAAAAPVPPETLALAVRVLAAARRAFASERPAIALADGASMDEFELRERLGRRSHPIHGNRYYGGNAGVVHARHRRTGVDVAVKLMFALANEGERDDVPMDVLHEHYGGEFQLLLLGGRVHALARDGMPEATSSAHVACVLSVFATRFTVELRNKVGQDPAFAASHTLAVVFPLMDMSLAAELSERRERGVRYDIHEWAHRALQIAKGLSHVRALRIVHRDIKKDNILLRTRHGGADDVLCLVSDFGECINCELVGIEDCVTGPGVEKGGAPGYRSPEVSRANNNMLVRDARIDYGKQDAWGLGYLLWELLSEDRPFPGGDPRHFTDGTYSPPVDADPRSLSTHVALRIVRELLRVSPAQRCSLSGAVERLEVLLFVVPMMANGVDGAISALRDRLADVAGRATRGAHVTVADMLLADFFATGRASAAAVTDVLLGVQFPF